MSVSEQELFGLMAVTQEQHAVLESVQAIQSDLIQNY